MQTDYQMKVELVADQIASFQRALEKAYAAKGVQYPTTLSQVVSNYANSLIYAYELVPEREETVGGSPEA